MQLRFQTGGDDWMKGLCTDFSARTKILGLKFAENGREIAHFVDITSDAERMDEVKDQLDASATVLSMELTDLSRAHSIGVVVARECAVCTSLIETDLSCFISSASTEEDCAVGYKVFLGGEGVPVLLNKLSSRGVGYKIIEISPITSSNSPLTSRQLGVLKSAMETGLYDFPRRITQDELAARLGIKTSTLNEILRRAERKILGGFLDE